MTVLTGAQMMMYAQSAGFTGQSIIDCASVGYAESGGNTTAVNPTSGNTGVMQIGPKGTINDAGVGLTQAQLEDPATNFAAAHTIWSRAGGTFAKDWTTWGGPVQQLEAATLSGTTPAASGATATEASWEGDLGSALGGILGAGVGAPQIGSSLGGDIGGLTSVATDVGNAAVWISTPSNWLHVLYVVGGVIVAVIGLNILAKPITQPAVAAVKKGAATAAKIGALAA
jgi:hypothetical protein